MVLTIIFVIAVVATLWVTAVWAFFHRPVEGVTTHLATTKDGWQIAVHHRPAVGARRFRQPVILAHGLANNHRVMALRATGPSLARALAGVGFEVYALDFRGAGMSVAPDDERASDATFDDYVRFDAPAVVALVRQHAQADKVFWVGHSLGGLVGIASLTESLKGQLAGLVTLGSPAFFALPRSTAGVLAMGPWLAPSGRFPAEWLSALAAPLMGWLPLKMSLFNMDLNGVGGAMQRAMMGGGISPIWRGVAAQLRRWAKTNEFTSTDGVDYRASLKGSEVPMLVVGGTLDMLAGPEASKSLAALLPEKMVTLHLANVDGREFGHNDLIVGEHAEKGVFEVAATWLVARAEAIDAGKKEGGGVEVVVPTEPAASSKK